MINIYSLDSNYVQLYEPSHIIFHGTQNLAVNVGKQAGCYATVMVANFIKVRADRKS